jgi:hypothetical protein
MTTSQKATATAAISHLRQLGLTETSTIICVWRGRSKSGMTRYYDFYFHDGEMLLRMTYSIAVALGYTYDRKQEALKIGGCGFSATDQITRDLAHAMFGAGLPFSHQDI